MEFIRQQNGDVELRDGKNVVGWIFAPDKRSFDGRFIVRRRGKLDAGQEIWLTFPGRFPDEESARRFVMRNWLRIRKFRLMTKRGEFTK